MTAQTNLPNPVSEKAYWVEDFKVTDEDLDYLYNLFLETEEPLSLRDITYELINSRIKQENSRIKKQLKSGAIFQPKHSYEVGQVISFPSFGYESGEIIDTRPGNNAEYGEFDVINVKFDDGTVKEFACNLAEHALNVDVKEAVQEEIDPSIILKRYGRAIARKIKSRFDEDDDVVYLAGRWFLQSLLVDINIAHLHLAEAVLDMNGGGPMSTDAIFAEIGMSQEVNHHLQIFSLDYAMQKDQRFDEVGAAGVVAWYLQRMEPEQVHKVPLQLQYNPLPYDASMLDDEMRNLLISIDDELSPIELEDDDEDEVTLTLTYPYRRTGTLPLSARLQYLFPTAYETTRIQITMVDAQSGDEVAGWVVREHGYVYGFEEFYQRYMLPVGAYITLRRDTEDPRKLIVDFANRPRPRTEWIHLAIPDGKKLRFEKERRSIGADYDELMNFGVDDLEGLDALWPSYENMSIEEILRRLIPELASLSPQKAVHITTLYSAFNLLRRCPPDPIFAKLVEHPDFENISGPYWRLAK